MAWPCASRHNTQSETVMLQPLKALSSDELFGPAVSRTKCEKPPSSRDAVPDLHFDASKCTEGWWYNLWAALCLINQVLKFLCGAILHVRSLRSERTSEHPKQTSLNKLFFFCFSSFPHKQWQTVLPFSPPCTTPAPDPSTGRRVIKIN